MTRHLLEILAGQNPVYFPLQFLVHYPLAYASPFLALVLVLHLASGVELPRLSRLMLHVWALTLLPPLVDVLAGRGAAGIGYLQPGFMPGTTILTRFLDPRVPFVGTTSGIRFETAIACLLAALYVVVTRVGRHGGGWSTAPRAVAAAAGVYVVALGFFTLPVLASATAEALLDPRRGPLFGAPRILSVSEPVALTTADQACVLYLVPLCLVLLGVSLRRARRASEVAAPTAPAGDRIQTGIAALRGLLAGGLGVVSGALVRSAIDGRLPVASPLDLGTALAIPAAAALTEIGALRLTLPGLHPLLRGVPATAGLLLALSAGSPPALLLLVTLFLSVSRRVAPLHLDRWPLARAAAAGIGAVAALGAGSSWALGADALALLPPALALVLGIAAGLAAGLEPNRPSVARDRRYAQAAALAVLLAAGVGLGGSLALPGTRARLVGSAVTRPKWIVRRAMAAETAGKPDQARSLYRRALSLDPRQALVHARLGQLLIAAGDTKAASASLAEAVAIDPMAVPARQQLAMLLLASGRRDEAIALLRAAADLAPRDPVIAWSMAQALTHAPALPGAAEAWRRYLDLSAGLPAEDAHRDEARARLRALVEGTRTD